MYIICAEKHAYSYFFNYLACGICVSIKLSLYSKVNKEYFVGLRTVAYTVCAVYTAAIFDALHCMPDVIPAPRCPSFWC